MRDGGEWSIGGYTMREPRQMSDTLQMRKITEIEITVRNYWRFLYPFFIFIFGFSFGNFPYGLSYVELLRLGPTSK